MTSDSYSIGVDFGGTNLRIAAYSPSSGFLETIQIPARVQAGRDAVVGDMCLGIRKLVDLHSAKYSLRGIAIGSPGPLELPEGRLRNPPNLPGFDGLEIAFGGTSRARASSRSGERCQTWLPWQNASSAKAKNLG